MIIRNASILPFPDDSSRILNAWQYIYQSKAAEPEIKIHTGKWHRPNIQIPNDKGQEKEL